MTSVVKAATAEAQALFPIEAPGTETVIEGWDDPLWGDRQRARTRLTRARIGRTRNTNGNWVIP